MLQALRTSMAPSLLDRTGREAVTYERLRASSAVAVGIVVDTSLEDALMEFLPEDHSTVRRRPHSDANALLAFSSEERVRKLRNQLPEGSRFRDQVTRIDRRDRGAAVVAFLCGVAVGALVMLLLVIAHVTA
jgi:hypothetical protein